MNEYQEARDLFGNYRLAPKEKGSEYGELLRYFSQKLGWDIKRVAAKVEGLELPDLYYVKSSCDSYEREGKPWGKAFNGMLRVR